MLREPSWAASRWRQPVRSKRAEASAKFTRWGLMSLGRGEDLPAASGRNPISGWVLCTPQLTEPAELPAHPKQGPTERGGGG